MIDAHARTIFDDMVVQHLSIVLTAHNHFGYPLDVMIHLPYWGISRYFIDEIVWL